MYKFVSAISLFIRQFYLPNPYVQYFENEVYAELFNLIIGGIVLHVNAYFLTSSVYDKNKHQSWIGSFWYCVNYIFNTFLMNLLCYKYSNLGLLNIIIIVCVINFIIWMISKIIINRFEQKINIFI